MATRPGAIVTRTNLQFLLRLVRNPTQRKHALRWWDSLQKDYLLRKRQPWLVFDAIDFLQSLDLRGKHVFEYGSGGSTLFWASLNASCVSIEHDPTWFGVVSQRLASSPRTDHRLVLPERGENTESCNDPADPECYVSSDSDFQGFTFHAYVSQIDAFPDKYFDVILVDGRARPSCIKHSVLKVKPGGILIVDNSDRDYYLIKTRVYLRDFEARSFSGAAACILSMSSTAVFTRRH